ncbi:MAG: GAF domain-containing protein [Symplocastrum torsivum CPER-KK1]|jgi:methyl-accepting chemotaxis protein|uniref:GAF domain-containing protein n=1 Tax=Symplocastrum torsivum CPER-KK1 TaxID=450513 RepID=A0A951PP19_9CYAN|nr:GAF domain-containing protein [Symplocastrum torsivum CPER-KK1]
MVKQFDRASSGNNKIPDNIYQNGVVRNSYTHTASTKSVSNEATERPVIVLPDSQTPPPKPNPSLRTQLLTTILPAVLIPLGLAGLVSYNIAAQRAQHNAEALLQSKAQLARDVSRNVLEESATIPTTVATNPLVIDAARASGKAAQASGLPQRPIDQTEQAFSTNKLNKLNQALNDYLKRTAETGKFAEIFFTDKHGFNVAYSTPTSDFVQNDEAWWQRGKKGDKQVVEPQLDQSSNTVGVDISQPITDPASGEFLGVVKAVLPATRFDFVLDALEETQRGESEQLQILAFGDDSKAIVIKTLTSQGTSTTQAVLGGEVVAKKAADLIKNSITTQTSDGGTSSTSFVHERARYALATVPNTNWVVVSSIDTAEIGATGREAALISGLIFLGLAGVTTAILWLLARRLSEPLNQLAGAAEQVAAGNLDVSAQPNGSAETQTLAQSFNNLVVRVKDLLQQQAAQSEKIQTYADTVNAATRGDSQFLFDQAVQDAQKHLNVDRVVIYGFEPDLSGSIVAEAVDPGWPRALADRISDPCIPGKLLEEYKQGRIVPTSDVRATNYSPAHLQLLNRLQVKANLVVPIIAADNLLGLMVAHQCSRTHEWQESEINYLTQLATQVGVSLTGVSFAAQKEAEAKRAQQLNEIISRVRESLNVEEIYHTAITGIRETLKTDRAVVYLFDEDWQGTIVAESVANGWPKALGANIADPCFAEQYVEKYKRGRVKATENIYDAGLTKCYLGQLEPFKVKANLVAPILAEGRLLGLLVTHQCSSTRPWQEADINFFKQVAIQLGFALDQAAALEQREQARIVAELISEEQRHEKEALQLQLLELLSDVEGAARGDLTVRADVTVGEIGTVADFFNAVIESLRGIVTQVKTAATQVNTSLGENEGAIRQLSSEALKQAEDTTRTLDSVEQMTRSIQEVAENARQAAVVARTASSTAEVGGQAMDRSVQNILKLRETVAETAKKVKRLGESSQQISKVVSLINQIALQTNLLAINAGIEAARAGEEGQGFAVVAEEVGELAARSAAATKEIEKIVENIQQETSEVVEAMELGTTQVVEGTHLVEDAKQSLSQILDVSRQIDVLVQSISSATVSQVETSQAVTELMKEIALVSERTSHSTRQISGSLQETVGIAAQLQASVGTFKVGD